MKQDKIRVGLFDFDDAHVRIDGASVTYAQSADGHSSDGEQILRVTAHTEIDEGYFMTIETKRWAIDDVDEFIFLLEDFKKRFGNPNPKKE